jgi:uncharacterized protein (DUF2147 family)
MNRLVKFSMAALVALGMVAPALAQDRSVEGLWQPDKNSDYRASLCGKDNDRFCLTVMALRGKMRKPENLEYLGKNIVNEAKPAGKNTWKGKINLLGISGDATITLLSSDQLHLKACAYVVVCKEITLKRKS